jgi:hypothetical protein
MGSDKEKKKKKSKDKKNRKRSSSSSSRERVPSPGTVEENRRNEVNKRINEEHYEELRAFAIQNERERLRFIAEDAQEAEWDIKELRHECIKYCYPPNFPT